MTINISHKRKIDKLYFTKISKSFQKTLLRKRQVTNWEKYSQDTHRTKDFYLEYLKIFYFNNKFSNIPVKMGKKFEESLHKRRYSEG